MRKPKLHQNHQCCPAEFRNTSDITGLHTMDAVIQRNPNKDMAAKLSDHIVEDVAYKINNGYGHGSIS